MKKSRIAKIAELVAGYGYEIDGAGMAWEVTTSYRKPAPWLQVMIDGGKSVDAIARRLADAA